MRAVSRQDFTTKKLAGTISYHLWQVVLFFAGWYDYAPIVAGIRHLKRNFPHVVSFY